MRRWRSALALLCAAAEEALDTIPGVEVVRVAPLPPAVPSHEAAAYAATLVNVSVELQVAGGASIQLSASAWDAASRTGALAEACGYDAAGCAQAETVLATRAAAARWAHASVGRGADHSFWPPFFCYESGSGSPAALFTYHLLPGEDGRAPIFELPVGPRKLLEVGSFEGGAAMWFAKHFWRTRGRGSSASTRGPPMCMLTRTTRTPSGSGAGSQTGRTGGVATWAERRTAIGS